MKKVLLSIYIIFLILSTTYVSNAQIVFNEILASNTSTNLDEQSKEFADWIELYNYSDHEVSIGDWYLTDNKKKPAKWKIPFYYSIATKGYKVFWADKLNTSNHTNFKLCIEGETLYLFDKDTVLKDSISYPRQVSDISYGRIAGSENAWGYFQKATPSAENSSLSHNQLTFSGQVKFSQEAGFYQKPIVLKLLAQNDNEKIYYTLDGSKPDQESIIYTKPIEIKSNTVVRARTYSNSYLPGKVVTKSFLLTQKHTLPVVSLSVDPEYFWDKKNGIYVKGLRYVENDWKSANYFQEWERPVSIEYFNTNGEKIFDIDAGTRIHGRSSRKYEQKSLAIFAREKYDQKVIPGTLFNESYSDTIRSFLLRNAGNDWGTTMFLDGLVHTLVMEELNIDAQLYKPAIVYINGEYWGIHNIREKVNEYYFTSKCNETDKKVDIVEANSMVGSMESCKGDLVEFNKMMNFIENHDLSQDTNYQTLRKYIDTDEFINYLITQIFIGNRDWPYNNMKFWRFRDDTSKWRCILYDTDLSFIKSSEYAQFNMFEQMLAVNSEDYVTPTWSNDLLRNLFTCEAFKEEFVQRMAVYLNTVFSPEHIFHVIDSLKGNIEQEVPMNINKWGGIKQEAVPYLVTSKNLVEWEANINFVKRFTEDRSSDLRKKALEYFELKDTVNLRLNVNDGKAGKLSIMGYNIGSDKFEGYVFADIPISLEAIPNEGYEFVKWKGGEYDSDCSIKLTKNKKLTAVFRKIEGS